MPIYVIRFQVGDHGNIKAKVVGPKELEAAEFYDQDLLIQSGMARERTSDITGHSRPETRLLEHMAREEGGRGLAVASRDTYEGSFQVGCQEIDLPDHPYALSLGPGNWFGTRGHPGSENHGIAVQYSLSVATKLIFHPEPAEKFAGLIANGLGLGDENGVTQFPRKNRKSPAAHTSTDHRDPVLGFHGFSAGPEDALIFNSPC